MDVKHHDGHQEHFDGDLKEMLDKAERALENPDVEKVTIYPDPHPFAGSLQRCSVCGRKKHDALHHL